MRDSRDSIDFRNEEIGKLFTQLFFPTLLGMLFNMAFIFTDGIFVGHGIGPQGLAAINLIGPIMLTLNGLGTMFGIGISVVAAIHLSKGNTKAARLNTTQAFIAGSFVSVLIGTLCYCFPKGMLELLGASGAIYDAAFEYYVWFLPTCLLTMLQTIGLFVIRLDGSPRYAMLSNIIPAMVNIALDYLFIFPCGWGLMGASLATDIGGLVGVLMVMYYMIFKAKTLKFHRIKRSLKSLQLSLRNVGYMIRTGASGLVGELAVAVMMLTGNWMFKRILGDDGISAFSIACYLSPLVFMMYNAVAQSAQPIISYNHGAQQTQRVRKTMSFSLTLSIILGVLLSAIFVFFSTSVVRVFLEGGTVAGTIAADGLPYFASGFVFMAVNICLTGYYQSVERAGMAVLITSLRGIIFLVAAFVLLPVLLGKTGLWLAIPTAELLTTLVIVATQIFKSKSVNREN